MGQPSGQVAPSEPRSLTGTQTATKHYMVFAQFDTMDTHSVRPALPPTHLAWCENLQIIAPNYLNVVPGPLAALTTIVGKTVTRIFYATYASNDYAICFCTDGSATQVNLASGAQVSIAGPGTFSQTPDVAIWSSQRILIADPTAGYCTWDGVAFVRVGGVSPNIVVTAGGAGYNSGANVAITGGSGSGATATATVVAGVVVAVVLTNPGTGFLPTDTLTVTITPVAGGSGATATAIPWPTFALVPTTLAVFQGRVWIAGGGTSAGGRVLSWTGTGGYDDVLAAHASGSTTINDSDLVH